MAADTCPNLAWAGAMNQPKLQPWLDRSLISHFTLSKEDNGFNTTNLPERSLPNQVKESQNDRSQQPN